MLRFIWYAILAVVVALLVVEGMANRQLVTLTLLPTALESLVGWNFSFQLPLFVVILGSVAVGLMLGYVFEWIRESKHRREVAKRQKQVKSLNREVSRLRVETKQGKDDVLAILDDAANRKAG